MGVPFYIEPKHYDEAEANGINAECLRARIYHLGWPIEKAVTKPVQQRNAYHVKQARANGIPANRYHDRVRHGWSKEKASTTPVMTKEEVYARSHQGGLLVSAADKQTAHAHGIAEPTVYSRLQRGWSKAEAITVPPMTKRSRAKRSTETKRVPVFFDRALAANDAEHMRWMRTEGMSVEEIAEDYNITEQRVRKVVGA